MIREWKPNDDIEMLAELIHAVVHAGAGISFIVPFSMDEARAFWREKALAGVRVIVAGEGDRIVGTVQIVLDMPPNQQHRADIAKMMVHPDARRQGVARQLMVAIEEIAREEDRRLLVLDTVTGGPAESLYRSLGYIEVGIIPRFARSSLTPALEGTTIMYKELA